MGRCISKRGVRLYNRSYDVGVKFLVARTSYFICPDNNEESGFKKEVHFRYSMSGELPRIKTVYPPFFGKKKIFFCGIEIITDVVVHDYVPISTTLRHVFL